MPPTDREERKVFICADDINGNKDTVQKKMQAAKQYYDEENERLKSIEGKVSMFITSSGFLGTVFIGTSNILISQKDADIWFVILLVLCLLFFVIYMVRAITNSIEALARKTYSRPDPTTMIAISKSVDYDKQAIADLLNSTILNQNTTNLKLDYVIVAQRNFKRLILSVLAFTLVLFIQLFDKTEISFFSWFDTIKEKVTTLSLNLCFVVFFSILTIISLIIGSFALYEIQRHCRREKENTSSS